MFHHQGKGFTFVLGLKVKEYTNMRGSRREPAYVNIRLRDLGDQPVNRCHPVIKNISLNWLQPGAVTGR